MAERIDVVMCTYNSNKPYFPLVLRRIVEEIPVACFILVDRYSSDDTVAKVLEVFPRARVIPSFENLGRARKIGIDLVDTEFFAFIDDDVILLKGWYECAKRLMREGIGAVAFFARDRPSFTRGIYYEALYPRLVVSSKDNVDVQRGYAYATLLRKKAITTWNPDRMLAACEDHEILRHVVREGYLWLTSFFVFAEHIQPSSYFMFFRNLWSKEVWSTAGGRYIGVLKYSLAQLIFVSLLKVWAGIKISFLFRNAFIVPYYCIDALAFFYGYICWKKNLFLKRQNA